MKYRIILKSLAVFVVGIAVILGFFRLAYKPAQNPDFGINYSHQQAKYLGFDPKQVYLDILNDLKPKKLRLMAYWEDMEAVPGKYDFQLMDEFLIEAGKRDISVILAVGHKLPRWPECHHPAWYEQLPSEEQDRALLKWLESAVGHFSRFEAIEMWQVENEPFFEFGYECGKIPEELLNEEVKMVRSLDHRPILLTDSGETGGYWIPTAKLGADAFGTTMYRTVHNKLFGYYKYPLPPFYYQAKAGILKKFVGIENVLGVELQAEPWFVTSVYETPLEEQLALMNPKVFKENIEYAEKVGFKDNYLWGVEWWYWLAKEKGDWGMWHTAKNALSD